MKKEQGQRHILKFIAVFFAVSLWFYVLNSEPVQIDKKLPLNFIVPKGYAIASLNETELSIKLKGSKGFIQNVFGNKESLTIDLTPYFSTSGNTFKVKFYSSDIKVPFGIEVLDISPKETTILLDRKVTMELPIKLQFIGVVPKDRKLRELRLSEESVTISGPVNIIRTYSRIDSSPVNLQTFSKDDGEIQLSLAELDSRIKVQDSLKVKLKYKTQLINKKLKQ